MQVRLKTKRLKENVSKKEGKKKGKNCVNKLIQMRRETKTKNACKHRPPTHLLLPFLYIGSPDK
jgi:hypothetical protein